MSDKSNIDSVLTYILVKKLVTPIAKTKAYKMGLVDAVGKTIKSPETDEEEESLTLFDKFIFKLKRVLGAKISLLNRFLYLQTLNNDFYNKLIVRGSVEQRAEIKRIENDIKVLESKYGISFDDYLLGLLSEMIDKEI
jgi:hypothetical protein